MFNFFKPKDEKDFLYLEKNLSKRKEKGRKISTLVELPRIKSYVEDILKKETPYDYISCYNQNLTRILDSYFEKHNYKNDGNRELLEMTKYQLDSEITRNINSLAHKLKTGAFVFEEKEEKKKGKSKGKDVKVYNLDLPHRKMFYLEDMTKLLDDKQLDHTIITSFFHGVINNVSKVKHQEKNYLYILKKIISHPNFNKRLLIDFMYSQVSKEGERGYLHSMKGGDDLDLNLVKTFILENKYLKHHEVLGLATLPYISLWETLINKYFLTQHLILDFLDNIFQFKKPEEKEIILNFINTKLSRVYKNPEIKYKIQDYLQSTEIKK